MRRQLALLAAATTSIVLVAFLVPLALLVRQVAADRAATRATIEVQSLAPVVASGDRRLLDLTLAQANVASRHPITVFLPDGGVLGAPTARSRAVELAARGRSITAEAPGGREIMVAVQGGPGGTAVLRTFVTDAQLHAGVLRAWMILGLLGLVLLGLGVAVADRLARSLLRPITALASVSYRLARGDLEARVCLSGPPEIRDVGAGLNHLAGRIRELLAQEREVVADLSHRLRTPLTALRLESESLRNQQEADRVGAAVSAVERTVTEIIQEARYAGRAESGTCEAAGVVAERVAFWSALAEDQERPVHVAVAPGPVLVRVSRDELVACVDALLGNVFAHTPEGTAFTVGLDAAPGGGARLVIGDDGPGFGDPRLLGRGVSGAASTGLGLDIARRTAEASGGSLHLGSPPGGGAEITLDLGAPDRAP